MKKYFILIIIIFNANRLFAHCQVPCGIYDDALRIIMIKEDFNTIDKAINMISKLSKKEDAISQNQINRWIDAKDAHASNIQGIVSDYFLAQRIKKSNTYYVDQLKNLHHILVIAMKCKQDLDINNVKTGLSLIDDFSNLYFDKHGLDHLKKWDNIK